MQVHPPLRCEPPIFFKSKVDLTSQRDIRVRQISTARLTKNSDCAKFGNNQLSIHLAIAPKPTFGKILAIKSSQEHQSSVTNL